VSVGALKTNDFLKHTPKYWIVNGDGSLTRTGEPANNLCDNNTNG